MIIGGLLAASSFLVCMFLQLAVEAQDSNSLSLINAAPCEMTVNYKLNNAMYNFSLAHNKASLKINRPYPEVIEFVGICKNHEGPLKFTYKPKSSHHDPHEKIITLNGNQLRVVDVSEVNLNERERER